MKRPLQISAGDEVVVFASFCVGDHSEVSPRGINALVDVFGECGLLQVLNDVGHKLLHQRRALEDHGKYVVNGMLCIPVGFQNDGSTGSLPVLVEKIRSKSSLDRFNE